MRKSFLFFCCFLFLWANLYANNYVINCKKDLERALQLKVGSCTIEGDINLAGNSITLPNGIHLYFHGGKIRNGHIIGTRTYITADYRCFEEITLSGTFESQLSLVNVVDCHNTVEDCARYINNLFEIQNEVVIPDYSIHIYSPIHMDSGKRLRGHSQLYSTIYVHNCNGVELSDDVRNVDISYLSLTNINREGYYPKNNSSGICCTGEVTGAHIRIHDVNINGFKYGVHFVDVFWSSSVERCRFNHCDIGFWGERKSSGSSIVNTFKDDYFNECKTYGLILDSYNEVMISGCNFGGIDIENIEDKQIAMCRLNYCKCVEIRCCNFEKMSLTNFSAALYLNTCDAIVSSCTFSDLRSANLPNAVSSIAFSSAILANYKSNVEISNMRTRNNMLFSDILSYEKAVVNIHLPNEYNVKTQTFSGGVINCIR